MPLEPRNRHGELCNSEPGTQGRETNDVSRDTIYVGERMPASAQEQVNLAAALVRLYVLLTQYLDRCVDESVRSSCPDTEFRAHLVETRRQLLDIVSVNPVVKQKLTEECDRIVELGASCLKSSSADKTLRETIQAERAMLRNKTIALSDLVAVFRAMA